MKGLFAFMAMAILLAFVTVYAQEKQQFGAKFLMKSIASMAFMIMAFVALYINHSVELWQVGIVIGLLFGLMGDVVLAVSGISHNDFKQSVQLSGAFSFLVGHIVYFVVFFSMPNSFNWWLSLLILLFPITVFGMIKIKILSKQPEQATMPMLIYAFIIGSMLVASLNLFISRPAKLGAVIFVGALLFTLSDLLLSLYYFSDIKKDSNKKILAFVYMPTYYVAQTFFALSLVL